MIMNNAHYEASNPLQIPVLEVFPPICSVETFSTVHCSQSLLTLPPILTVRDPASKHEHKTPCRNRVWRILVVRLLDRRRENKKSCPEC
jgi:hypothetical protein